MHKNTAASTMARMAIVPTTIPAIAPPDSRVEFLSGGGVGVEEVCVGAAILAVDDE